MVFLGGNERFVSVCRRWYSGVFWDVFVRGKYTRGREVGRECDGVPEWDKMEIRKV